MEREDLEEQRRRVQQELRDVRLRLREEEEQSRQTAIKWGRIFFSVQSSVWLAVACAALLGAMRLISLEEELGVAGFFMVIAVVALLAMHFFLEQLRQL